eukprot:4818113-Prymnesium_polylepis.1
MQRGLSRSAPPSLNGVTPAVVWKNCPARAAPCCARAKPLRWSATNVRHWSMEMKRHKEHLDHPLPSPSCPQECTQGGPTLRCYATTPPALLCVTQ